MNTIHYQIVNYIYTKLTKQPLKYYYSEKHLLNDYIKDKFYYINSTIEYSKKGQNDITNEQFKILITELYEVLKLRITKQQFYELFDHYITLIVADCCLENRSIDITHCLDHLYYLTTFKNQKVSRKIADDIPYLQNKLYQQFNIQEKLSEKIKRKVRLIF